MEALWELAVMPFPCRASGVPIARHPPVQLVASRSSPTTARHLVRRASRRSVSAEALRLVALALWVLLPSASGAPANGLPAAATNHTPLARHAGQRGLGGGGDAPASGPLRPRPRPRATEVAAG